MRYYQQHRRPSILQATVTVIALWTTLASASSRQNSNLVCTPENPVIRDTDLQGVPIQCTLSKAPDANVRVSLVPRGFLIASVCELLFTPLNFNTSKTITLFPSDIRATNETQLASHDSKLKETKGNGLAYAMYSRDRGFNKKTFRDIPVKREQGATKTCKVDEGLRLRRFDGQLVRPKVAGWHTYVDAGPLMVQVLHETCEEGKERMCVKGVAAQHRNEFVTILANGTQPQLTVSKENASFLNITTTREPTDNSTVITDVLMLGGYTLRVKTDKNGKMKVRVTISAMFGQRTVGLCGTFDGSLSTEPNAKQCAKDDDKCETFLCKENCCHDFRCAKTGGNELRSCLAPPKPVNPKDQQAENAKQKASEEEAKRKASEEEAKRKAAAEEEAKRKAAEEEAKRQAEEAAAAAAAAQQEQPEPESSTVAPSDTPADDAVNTNAEDPNETDEEEEGVSTLVSCENGGVKAEDGTCQCQPGFQGQYCESSGAASAAVAGALHLGLLTLAAAGLVL